MKYRVTIGSKSYGVEIEDLSARPIQVKVDGEQVAVHLQEEEVALPVSTMAVTSGAPKKPSVQPVVAAQEYSTKMLNAPIPGKIIAVFVHEGDLVSVGQELLTLEAMKMKNAIRSNRAGTVGQVCVAAGDSVRHGQPLIEFME